MTNVKCNDKTMSIFILWYMAERRRRRHLFMQYIHARLRMPCVLWSSLVNTLRQIALLIIHNMDKKMPSVRENSLA